MTNDAERYAKLITEEPLHNAIMILVSANDGARALKTTDL
jgi:hypothetical protein